MVFCFLNCSDLLEIFFSSSREKLLKFEDEGKEFAKISAIFETEYFFLCSCRFLTSIQYIKTIRIQIGKNNWDLVTVAI